MLDSLLFYIFFEAALIPLFFMVVLWGGEGRIYASLKLFLYTMAGSLLFLLSLVLVYRTTGTLDMVALPELVEHIPSHWKYWLWGAMFVAFAVKIPMWPVHGWLPDAHVQAPTGASMILAGIVLKLGGYGMIRFCLALFPDISAEMSPWVMGLSLAGLVVASFAAFGHRDIKKIIAYSSVAHMAMVTAGLFTSQIYGIQGAIFQMVSHGVISAGLFAVVGSIYSRLHTRDMGSMGGLAHRMPRLALVTMVLVFGSVGLPGTSGFVGEFLVLLGSFEWHPFLTLGLSLGMVMGAVYMLSWMRGIMFGGYDRDRWGDLRDLAWSEKSVLFPLALATIWLGLAPSFVTHYTSALAERWLPSSRSTVTVTNES
jgi:NADH-quinone oxidoreductase subunit M